MSEALSPLSATVPSGPARWGLRLEVGPGGREGAAVCPPVPNGFGRGRRSRPARARVRLRGGAGRCRCRGSLRARAEQAVEGKTDAGFKRL